uniref:Uncharacterized protein n=1 Tax=Romanomermis culicivorax TaxID=13658 RepID=A0A915J4Z4_ROMCU
MPDARRTRKWTSKQRSSRNELLQVMSHYLLVRTCESSSHCEYGVDQRSRSFIALSRSSSSKVYTLNNRYMNNPSARKPIAHI